MLIPAKNKFFGKKLFFYFFRLSQTFICFFIFDDYAKIRKSKSEKMIFLFSSECKKLTSTPMPCNPSYNFKKFETCSLILRVAYSTVVPECKIKAQSLACASISSRDIWFSVRAMTLCASTL